VNVTDQELLRARWRRALHKLALDRITRDDFGRSTLAQRLNAVTVQLALLPGDPEANVVSINASLDSCFRHSPVSTSTGQFAPCRR
jgi:hypothetical protein